MKQKRIVSIVGPFSAKKVRTILNTALDNSLITYQEEKAFPNTAFHISGPEDQVSIVQKYIEPMTRY
jgi:hypothetical protein